MASIQLLDGSISTRLPQANVTSESFTVQLDAINISIVLVGM